MSAVTGADVARLTQMLRDNPLPWPKDVARALLEQGVMLPPPPPNPAAVVVAYVRSWEYADDAVLKVQDLFPSEALEAAAAKIAGDA